MRRASVCACFGVVALLGCGGGDPWASVLSDEELASLEAVGLTIYRGESPPNIVGAYFLDELVITYDDGSLTGSRRDDYVFELSGQSGSTVLLSYRNMTMDGTTTDIADGVGSFISGADGCFSVYSPLDGEQPDISCMYRLAQVTSGCLVADGIQDLEYGLLMIDQSAGCEGELIPIGTRRIITETDGIAVHN